jgi:hypothetical protein
MTTPTATSKPLQMSSIDIAGSSLSMTCFSQNGTCINPARKGVSAVLASWSRRYMTWLQTNVPAELEICAGTPVSSIFSTIFRIGSVEKYASLAPFIIGLSVGLFPLLSGTLASSMFIATRSGVMCFRPPACPTEIAARGFSLFIKSIAISPLAPNTVGSSSFNISMPLILSGNRFTASHDGLTVSPPKGVNPVTKTFTLNPPSSTDMPNGAFYRR